MDWSIVVAVVVTVAVLASVLRTVIRGRRRRPAELPANPAEDGIDPRDELARNAGVASFGLNLPWRRPRGVPSGDRPRRDER